MTKKSRRVMTQAQQRKAAREFAKRWAGRGYEKGESNAFWLSLLSDVYGIEQPDEFIRFEDKVKLDRTSFIDAYIDSTHVLIEQKSIEKDLNTPVRQSDGSLLSPFQQAKRYSAELPYSQRPRWIITCNFKDFHIYDMEKPTGGPEVIYLKNLEEDYYRMFFLVDEADENIKRATEVSLQAGQLVGKLYDALLQEYHDSEDDQVLKDLNILCVRLVFCFYAEDSGIFGRYSMFHDYLAKYRDSNFRDALIRLFAVLNQRPEERDPYIEEDLAAFPYVNGGLFERENIIIPRISPEIINIILDQASASFDWSKVSPTIFGSLFESTLNPETRHSGGMHYTSIENIHKVIDPLFLSELNQKFEDAKALKVVKTRNAKLDDLQREIANLKFLDPAAGSGNFLTETYLSLRRLENKIIKLKMGQQIVHRSIADPIQVSIDQFYGIEINDFAVAVAKTALWIAESQMIRETEDIVHSSIDFLPLKSDANIFETNALEKDWESLAPKDELNYIMGNPPFLGYSQQSEKQKEEMLNLFVDKNGKPYKRAGKIDYVAAWYLQAAKMIKDTDICVAFVSTNSITQGEQVPVIWKPLFHDYDIQIVFAHRTFRWDSEATDKAHVHVVVIGFCHGDSGRQKYVFENGMSKKVSYINSYLMDAPSIFIESRKHPISKVPEMMTGNRPADGGHLIIEADEYDEFLRKEPEAIKYIKKLTGSAEYINNKKRYCLWLVDATPNQLRRMPEVMKRIEACRQDRLQGAADRQQLADTPTLFRETNNPNKYIIVPYTSSERRKYIPMGFLDQETIPTDGARIIPDGTIYHLGVLLSNVHMAWMRTVAGRLKSDYRYSKDIVYNNFPWPEPNTTQKAKIEETAQAILNARELYPDSSLADLYDDLIMPPELRKAHQENDRAVMEAYGFNWRTMTGTECVAELMELHQKLTR